MVAKITVPLNIKRALNYNEQKVNDHRAACIYAQRFIKEVKDLNFYDKLHRFEHLLALNKRAQTNTVHISLNFEAGERIQKEKLIAIAQDYMAKIGFEEQPFLLYQHFDAAHPHLHIVSTNIRKDGSRISIHNIGKNQSSQARKEIEIEYGLVRAEQKKAKHAELFEPLAAKKLLYGKTPLKRALTNVLDDVLVNYRYCSLAELNAVLKLFNLLADRGKEDGIIFRKKGLVYRLLDEKGNKVGVPIKASSIYCKPTLSFLEKKFAENVSLKSVHKAAVRTKIQWVLRQHQNSIDGFKKALEKERIRLVIRQNPQGIIYGLTYVDFNSKCVFNGSDLGKECSANAVVEKLSLHAVNSNGIEDQKRISHLNERELGEAGYEQVRELEKTIIDDVLSPVEQSNTIPFHLRKQKKKKRKSN